MIEQTGNQSGGDHTADEAPAGSADCDPEPPPRRPDDERRLSDDERRLDGNAQAGAGRHISVEILHAAGDWSAIKNIDKLISGAAAAVARHNTFPADSCLSIALALSNDAEIQSLNNRYRGLDKPTNVLSFPALPEPAHPAGGSGKRAPEDERFIGDIILAAQTILREAQAQRKPAAHHLQHLVIHAILHLLGYDHECDDHADVMEAIEIDVLQSMMIPNPYNETVPGAIDA